MEYEFTLKFALSDPNADPETVVEALQEQGCDDALVGIGKRGRIALDFSREAESAEHAVASAIADVRRAVPGARFIEATPDFVGVTDIANILGCSRQNVTKILATSGSRFPDPVHEGSAAIWHLESVLTWLMEHQDRDFDARLVEISRVNMRCNHLRYAEKLAREAADPLRAAIA